jgi:Cu(I)/Ag(I) efflux system membrane fusion protein
MGGIKMEQAHMGKMDMPGMDMDKAIKRPEPAATKNAQAGAIKKKSGELTLVFSTDPTPVRIGENRIQVTVTNRDGKPVSPAQVKLIFTMPMPGMLPATVPMKSGTMGTYETKVNLGMAGQWDLTITIQRPGQPSIQQTFSVVAGGGSMSGMSGM